jgi:para-nitrobenzyl esterase
MKIGEFMSNDQMTRRDWVSAAIAGGVALALGSPGELRAAAVGDATTAVETGSGKVRGMRSGGVSSFLGVPYGADTGPRRFLPPIAPPKWAGVRDCFVFGARAPQGELNLAGIGSAAKPDLTSPVAQAVTGLFAGIHTGAQESEDCLFLNIYTPDASPRRRRPVMVWLHGGGFATGAGGVSTYDGSRLCQRDVVVVTLNHRLNAMGYLYLGALHEDFADSGNVGHLDIILALQWVRDNIVAFGGDPGNVTIFGESGGGTKVGTLLGMPPAKGLFHKAIQESGATVKMVDKADATQIAERTLAALGVAKRDVHQLQTMDCRKVIAAASSIQIPGAGFSPRILAPVVDGRSLPSHPFDPIATEISRDIPLIIGTNKDEWTLFMGTDPDFGRMTEQQARSRFEAMLGDRAPAAFEAYKDLRPNDTPTYWVSALMTDLILRKNSITEAERKSAQNAAPVYMYRFDWESPIAEGALRAFHGLEIAYVFNNTNNSFAGPTSESQTISLALDLSQAWVNFARTGNPSRKGLQWPRYDAGKRETMIFDVPSRVVLDPERTKRGIWAKWPT